MRALQHLTSTPNGATSDCQVFNASSVSVVKIIIIITTSGHNNLTKGCVTVAHGWFCGIRQVAPVCAAPNNLVHASLGPPESTAEMASRLVQPFLHSSCQSVVGHTRPVLSPWHGVM